MTSIVRSSRLGAVLIAAALGVAACGSTANEDGGAGGDAGSDAAAADASAATTATSPSTAADESPAIATASVLEVSETIDVAGAPLPELANPLDDPAVGTMAPVITGQTFDGSEITIGGPADGPTMLVFLAHWCPHCNDEIPEILTLRDSGALPDDLNIIGVSTAVADDRDNYPPSEWVVAKDWTYPVLADTFNAEAFITYGGNGFPYTVMLDADGVVASRTSGSSSADKIAEWIDAALTA